MYRIVNYDFNCSYPVPFSKFKTAFMVQQLKEPNSLIEFWGNGIAEVVWNPAWELNFQ